ncbi:PilW family protein [Cupriavidus sp. BIS7]|uniref:PilW family protein n=1 Tax=Cupriavidus sp. BIS7 TaxID=1217718 RepID=UPI0003057C11|nr:PilW family protein [Cupriavidus sp. BIS7]
MPRLHRTSFRGRSAGYTLVELMVALVISLLVLMAAVSFYLMSRSSYSTIDDNASLEERGNFALSTLMRLTRQAAYVPTGSNGGSMPISTQMISGLDGCSTPSITVPAATGIETLSCGNGTAINNSDALMLRFYGMGQPGDAKTPDGSVVDCSGLGVAGATSVDEASAQRGLSTLYIGNGANGKPSLMCMYRPRDVNGQEIKDTYVMQELVPGVEAMKVLYGVSTNGDDVPDKFVTAGSVSSTDWPNVFAIKIALVVRADNASADAGAPASIQMFGPLYPGNGATYTPTVETGSARKLYYATVQIRNYQSCGDPSCS